MQLYGINKKLSYHSRCVMLCTTPEHSAPQCHHWQIETSVPKTGTQSSICSGILTQYTNMMNKQPDNYTYTSHDNKADIH